MQGENEYREALKIGQREVLAAPVKSESTTLPVLDNIISSDKVSAGIHIGVEQIPMNLIVGTKTEGRVNAFSPGFMPLLPEKKHCPLHPLCNQRNTICGCCNFFSLIIFLE